MRTKTDIFFDPELRENLTRVGANLKQGFIEAVRSTWATINQFARSHRTEAQLDMEDDVTETAVVKPVQNYDEENDEVIVANREEGKSLYSISYTLYRFISVNVCKI